MRPLVELIVLAAIVAPFLIAAAAILRTRVAPPTLAEQRERQRELLAAEWNALEEMLVADGWAAEKIAELKADVFAPRRA